MDALATVIRNTLADVTDVAVQVEPRWVSNPTPPCIDIYPADPSTTDPDLRAFGELIGGELVTVRARVDLSDTVAGQDLLLAFMDDEDPLSIVAAVDTDKTLGGLADATDMRLRSGYVRFIESGDQIGCLWQFVIVKAHS